MGDIWIFLATTMRCMDMIRRAFESSMLVEYQEFLFGCFKTFSLSWEHFQSRCVIHKMHICDIYATIGNMSSQNIFRFYSKNNLKLMSCYKHFWDIWNRIFPGVSHFEHVLHNLKTNMLVWALCEHFTSILWAFGSLYAQKTPKIAFFNFFQQ